jgi:hypothetical protein
MIKEDKEVLASQGLITKVLEIQCIKATKG